MLHFFHLAPDNTPIEVKPHLRDLGVQLSSSLNFSIHIENTVTAASKLVGWGLSTFCDVEHHNKLEAVQKHEHVIRNNL